MRMIYIFLNNIYKIWILKILVDFLFLFYLQVYDKFIKILYFYFIKKFIYHELQKDKNIYKNAIN